jgi:putative transposase
LAERGVAVSYETVRRWVNHFGPMIAADLRKRRLKPHTTWHLDEVYLKIDGRMVYLWRAVDAEGEVLEVLVQSKRNRHAALKLMCKLLRSTPSSRSGWSPTICDHTAQPSMFLGSNAGMSAGDGKTIERRIRISQRGGGSARCSGSRARVQPGKFLSSHAAVYNIFNVQHHLTSAQTHRELRAVAMDTWRTAVAAA